MDELKKWYQTINENDILSNGQIKLTVPVIDGESGEQMNVHDIPQEQEQEQEQEQDKVVVKGQDSALTSFLLTKKIQHLLLKIAELSDPYEGESNDRQVLIEKLNALHGRLGEGIASL